eukprot:Opistho-2@40408
MVELLALAVRLDTEVATTLCHRIGKRLGRVGELSKHSRGSKIRHVRHVRVAQHVKLAHGKPNFERRRRCMHAKAKDPAVALNHAQLLLEDAAGNHHVLRRNGEFNRPPAPLAAVFHAGHPLPGTPNANVSKGVGRAVDIRAVRRQCKVHAAPGLLDSVLDAYCQPPHALGVSRCPRAVRNRDAQLWILARSHGCVKVKRPRRRQRLGKRVAKNEITHADAVDIYLAQAAAEAVESNRARQREHLRRLAACRGALARQRSPAHVGALGGRAVVRSVLKLHVTRKRPPRQTDGKKHPLMDQRKFRSRLCIHSNVNLHRFLHHRRSAMAPKPLNRQNVRGMLGCEHETANHTSDNCFVKCMTRSRCIASRECPCQD